MAINKSLITLFIAIGLSVLVFGLVDQSLPVRSGLALLTLIAVLWMTETFNVTITALLVPVLAIVAGILDVKQALENFAHPVIFLFMGGFGLATALHQQRLDQHIAKKIIKLSRGRVSIAFWLTFTCTAFISMWISNTATTAMMLPLALGLLTRLDYSDNKPVYWYLLLGVAYSANVGGIGTLVGSPPNAIAAANTQISFTEWLVFGLPCVAIFLPVIILLLGWRYRPDLSFRFDSEIEDEPFTRQQKLTLLVFALTVCGWLFSAPLSDWLGIARGFDSLVALSSIILLAALRLISWDEFQQGSNWGVLMLFGGGLTLSAVLQQTGSSQFLGELIIEWLQLAPLFLFLLVLTLFVIMLTEVASNTASSALLIPIFINVATNFGMSQEFIAILIAIAASCAFMLPVATPPNAIVFGTGLLPQQQMMRTGIVLNVLITGLLSFGMWIVSQIIY